MYNLITITSSMLLKFKLIKNVYFSLWIEVYLLNPIFVIIIFFCKYKEERLSQMAKTYFDISNFRFSNSHFYQFAKVFKKVYDWNTQSYKYNTKKLIKNCKLLVK